MENSTEVLIKLKTELPYDLTNALLGIYPEKTVTQKDTSMPVFTEALFTIARTWKQPKSPSMKEWINLYTHTHTLTHTLEYYSAIKRNEMMPSEEMFMDPETVMQCEVRKRKKNII